MQIHLNENNEKFVICSELKSTRTQFRIRSPLGSEFAAHKWHIQIIKLIFLNCLVESRKHFWFAFTYDFTLFFFIHSALIITHFEFQFCAKFFVGFLLFFLVRCLVFLFLFLRCLMCSWNKNGQNVENPTGLYGVWMGWW